MKEKLKVFLMSLCSLLAIGFDYVNYLNSDEWIKGLKGCLKLGYTGTLILFVLIFYVFYKRKNKKNKAISFLSILFALFMVLGASYLKYGTAVLVYGSLYNFIIMTIIFLGYFFLFKLGLNYIYSFLDKYKNKEISNKVINTFKKHPFLISLIIIILCWLPYVIAYYPIILSPDPSFQIKQFFGIRTKYADYAILLDENVVLTNHHPVAHTVLIGSCLKLGGLLGNDNFGLFIYSLIQILILSCTLAYTIKYMLKDMNLSSKVGLIALLIYSLVPMYGVYAISGVKDTLFSTFIILYILLLHKMLNYKENKIKMIDCIKLVFVMLLVILFRNNGLHVILLSFPFLILAMKRYWKQLLMVFVIVIVSSTCYTKVLLPALKITPGSIREVLSIPFQQTARYVKYHSEDVSLEDKEVIDNLLEYDTLADRYNPDLADNVKNKYNKYATKEDLQEYFKVWFKGLIKHPNTYIDATVNNVYGYFYPEKTSWYLHTSFDKRITEDGFDYHYNNLDEYRKNVSDYVTKYPEIPLVGLFCNIALNTWMVFILVGYVISKKNYKSIVLYLPALVSILVCIASPANTYFRYAMPYIFSLPLMVSFVLNNKKS